MREFGDWIRRARSRKRRPGSVDVIVLSTAELGLSLVELVITLAIIGTLSSIVIPTLTDQVQKDKNKQAETDISVMSAAMMIYINDYGVPPDNLGQVGLAGKRDPWGNPYEYLNVISDGSGPPHPRKDHFLHPLNSDYDLYSKGEDGKTNVPLTAKASRDDIIRASNGGFIGLASGY